MVIDAILACLLDTSAALATEAILRIVDNIQSSSLIAEPSCPKFQSAAVSPNVFKRVVDMHCVLIVGRA